MVDSSVLLRLRGIGLAPALVQPLAAAMSGQAGATPMRVAEVQREGLLLHDGEAQHEARQLPALRNALDAQSDAVAVGDWVLAQSNAFGEWWVCERLPPHNQLARRLHDGRDKVTRVVIVSNVDTALLVMGLDHDFSLRRLERYLALVQMAGVRPVVVLSKADLCPDVASRLADVQALLPAAAAAVALNTLGDEVPQVLAPWLVPGQTLVLLGSSGAGKSTLTNSLTWMLHGAAAQQTGSTRVGDGKGRHTTTARSLHAAPSGACIIDTPGLRSLRLDGDAQSLDTVFEDIAQLASQCRFRDCGHQQEPGCAVREHITPERLRSFQKLQREAQRDSISAVQRKAQVQLWKSRGRDASSRVEAKRSGGGRD
jgi:ribosome biogenesis GTPase / thiamine phosphate phosphatase